MRHDVENLVRKMSNCMILGMFNGTGSDDDDNIVEKIMGNFEYISSETELLELGIWDEKISL